MRFFLAYGNRLIKTFPSIEVSLSYGYAFLMGKLFASIAPPAHRFIPEFIVLLFLIAFFPKFTFGLVRGFPKALLVRA